MKTMTMCDDLFTFDVCEYAHVSFCVCVCVCVYVYVSFCGCVVVCVCVCALFVFGVLIVGGVSGLPVSDKSPVWVPPGGLSKDAEEEEESQHHIIVSSSSPATCVPSKTGGESLQRTQCFDVHL